MDSDENEKSNDDKEDLEDDTSNSDLEDFFEESLEPQAIPSVSERNEEAPSSSRAAPMESAASEEFEASSSREAEGASNIPCPGPYASFIQQHREQNLREYQQKRGTQNEDQQARRPDCFASSSLHSFAASGFLKTSSKAAEGSLRSPDREKLVQQHWELSPIKKAGGQQSQNKPIEGSTSRSPHSIKDTSSMFQSYSMETEGACGGPEPSTQQTSLIRQYQDFNLMEHRQHERNLAVEGSSRSNTSSSSFLPSLNVSEGAAMLPGPFASFIQKHRDFEEMDDDSDDEDLEDRPVWPLERKQTDRPQTSASYRDSRSSSLGEYSEESVSRSASEASHSSGIQENKEASVSDLSPSQQQLHREINPPEDEVVDEDAATDEDEVELETEEQYHDSDSERKGYSL